MHWVKWWENCNPVISMKRIKNCNSSESSQMEKQHNNFYSVRRVCALSIIRKNELVDQILWALALYISIVSYFRIFTCVMIPHESSGAS